MNRSQIKVGEKYACVILADRFGGRPDATSNNLVRCVVVANDVEVQGRARYGRPAKTSRGYRVRVDGDQKFEIPQYRRDEPRIEQLSDGEEHVFERGESIVAPWAEYEQARAERIAKQAELRERRRALAERYAAIKLRLVALGLVEVSHSGSWSEDETGDFRRVDGGTYRSTGLSTRVVVEFDAIEKLLDALDGAR